LSQAGLTVEGTAFSSSVATPAKPAKTAKAKKARKADGAAA
jgi:hypothetical protein